MKLQFEGIDLSGIGGKTASPDLTWANLTVQFKDIDTDYTLAVETSLLLRKLPETTIAALESEARDQTKTILKAALALLEENDVASLALLEHSRVVAERTALGLVN